MRCKPLISGLAYEADCIPLVEQCVSELLEQAAYIQAACSRWNLHTVTRVAANLME